MWEYNPYGVTSIWTLFGGDFAQSGSMYQVEIQRAYGMSGAAGFTETFHSVALHCLGRNFYEAFDDGQAVATGGNTFLMFANDWCPRFGFAVRTN